MNLRSTHTDSDESDFDCDEHRAEILSEALEEDEELKHEAQNAIEAVIRDDEHVGELLDQPATKEAMTKVVMSAMMHSERHRGPLPSPRQLHDYDKCLPGAAERIVAMAEREQAHRHSTVDGFSEFRNETLAHVKTRDARGQYLGTFLCLSVIGLCFYMTFIGHATVGGSLAGVTLVGLAGVFYSRQRKAENTGEADLSD